MAATITTVVNPDTHPVPALVTRREAAVLTVALLLVLGAVVLLILASAQVTTALFGPG